MTGWGGQVIGKTIKIWSGSSSRLSSLTGSFTKPLAHGFVVGYFLQPITVHDTEVLENLIG